MLIDDNTLLLEYKSKNNPGVLDNKNNYKSGQRKLLAMEIKFLTKYGHLSDTVLYVGSAPGHHLLDLIGCFPSIKKWIFYDPSYTNIGKKNNIDIEIHKTMFTTEHSKKYKDKKILFISDIRSYESQDMGGKIPVEKANATIERDMKVQKEWVEAGNFIMSSLKFRLSWDNDENTNYFDGELYTQPWTGEYSPELRLFTDGKKYKIYNNKKIDNQMYWYNRVKRLEESSLLKSRRYTQCDYDQLLEYEIVKDYLLKKDKNIERMLDIQILMFINSICMKYKQKYRS